jgi:hypothetical protein
LKDLAVVIGSSADAVKKLGDALAHLVTLGVGGFDGLKARRTRGRLLQMVQNTAWFYDGGNAALSFGFERFVDRPNAFGWKQLLGAAQQATPELDGILADLRQEYRDIVLEDSFRQLVSSMHARSEVIARLRDMDLPTTPDEIAEMRRVRLEYRNRLVSRALLT